MLPNVGRPGRQFLSPLSEPEVVSTFGIVMVIEDTFVMSSERSTLKLFEKMCLSASVSAMLTLLDERRIIERSRPHRVKEPRARQMLATRLYPSPTATGRS